ncbi:uncharacterized protein LOC143193825 isoform X2 [Rhynchophorus ferrugineus]|uniref:uncharacterized protein LOC143193825 isoform X2 n=1 Tax=Rhynchophorus ferrugineus TaxID=354439 RepID=UPI003FCEB839
MNFFLSRFWTIFLIMSLISHEKRVDLDFSDCRRHSFLPSDWTEDRQDHVKNVKVLEFHEDDDLYMYMDNPSYYNEKPLEHFCTGSKYLGQWNRLGIAGVYRYPHGTIYDGYFNRNGEFHGSGILIYPSGQRIEGIWRNGKLQSDCTIVTKAGVVMNKHYCKMPDRRFQIEVENDLNPVGQEYLTNEVPPPRKIPEGCYDVGEGIYDPKIKSVISYKTPKRSKMNVNATDFNIFEGDYRRQSNFSSMVASPKSDDQFARLLQGQMYTEATTILWIPNATQEQWILNNTRKAWDEPTKFRSDLYEEWTKGGIALENLPLDSISCDVSLEADIFANIQMHSRRSDAPRLSTFIQHHKVEENALLQEIMVNAFLQHESTNLLAIETMMTLTESPHNVKSDEITTKEKEIKNETIEEPVKKQAKN